MNPTVLVIDDSITVRQQVGAALAGAGYAVLEAADGLQGKSAIENTPVQCVICDVNMPNMNGIEMVETVKGSGNFDRLPIVMLTTEGATDQIKKARAAGAAGWIVKPFKPEMLISAVSQLIERAAEPSHAVAQEA